MKRLMLQKAQNKVLISTYKKKFNGSAKCKGSKENCDGFSFNLKQPKHLIKCLSSSFKTLMDHINLFKT